MGESVPGLMQEVYGWTSYPLRLFLVLLLFLFVLFLGVFFGLFLCQLCGFGSSSPRVETGGVHTRTGRLCCMV